MSKHPLDEKFTLPNTYHKTNLCSCSQSFTVGTDECKCFSLHMYLNFKRLDLDQANAQT